MKIHIKNMVCMTYKTVVTDQLKKSSIPNAVVKLGEVESRVSLLAVEAAALIKTFCTDADCTAVVYHKTNAPVKSYLTVSPQRTGINDKPVLFTSQLKNCHVTAR